MSPQQQAVKNKPDRPRPHQTSQPSAKASAAPASLAPDGPASVEAQAVQLSRAQAQSRQSQTLALRLGQTYGNRHLQQVVTALKRPESERAETSLTGADHLAQGVVQREGEDKKGPSKIQQLDTLLDKFDVPEEEVISLLGKLDQPEKNTVLAPANGYKAKIASALNTEEMVRAVKNVTIGPYNPELYVKLWWVLAAAGSASSIDYAQIRDFIKPAPPEQKLALRNTDWRSFFVDVCTNKTIVEAVTDLNFDLATKLGWISEEMTVIRTELSYADIKSLITTASQTDKDALQGATWQDFFVKVCTNQTMVEALTDLGWKEIKPKIEWLIDEGSDYKTSLFEMIDKAEETPRKNVLASETLLARFRADFSPGDFWKIQLLLKYGKEGAFPAPVKTIFDALQAKSDVATLRRIIANLSVDECQKIAAELGFKEALKALLSAEDCTFINRMLTQGLLAEETGQGSAMSETLQVGDPATEAFAGKKFDWTSGFDVAYYRDRLEVTVRIALKPVDDTAKTQLATVQPIWKTNVEAAWNKFKITNAVHTLPVKFICDFTTSKPHHEVNVHPGSPTKWPGVDMGNWYTGKLTSPNHEFGHMLGNKDEYFLTKDHFTETTGIDPTTAPAGSVKKDTDTKGNERFTAQTSIMGISTQPVQPRHLNYFLNWVNKNRRQDVKGAFNEPSFTLI